MTTLTPELLFEVGHDVGDPEERRKETIQQRAGCIRRVSCEVAGGNRPLSW